MKVIIKIIFYYNLKENTESWVNLSEISPFHLSAILIGLLS